MKPKDTPPGRRISTSERRQNRETINSLVSLFDTELIKAQIEKHLDDRQREYCLESIGHEIIDIVSETASILMRNHRDELENSSSTYIGKSDVTKVLKDALSQPISENKAFLEEESRSVALVLARQWTGSIIDLSRLAGNISIPFDQDLLPQRTKLDSALFSRWDKKRRESIKNCLSDLAFDSDGIVTVMENFRKNLKRKLSAEGSLQLPFGYFIKIDSSIISLVPPR